MQVIPNGGPNTAVEVALVNGADGTQDIELRSLVWGDGLGWYRQQTLTLDSSDVAALIHALGTAQARLRTSPPRAPAGTVTPLPRALRRVDAPARADRAAPAAGTGLKTTCCKRYERKGRACKRCPQMAGRDTLNRRMVLQLGNRCPTLRPPTDHQHGFPADKRHSTANMATRVEVQPSTR